MTFDCPHPPERQETTENGTFCRDCGDRLDVPKPEPTNNETLAAQVAAWIAGGGLDGIEGYDINKIDKRALAVKRHFKLDTLKRAHTVLDMAREAIRKEKEG